VDRILAFFSISEKSNRLWQKIKGKNNENKNQKPYFLHIKYPTKSQEKPTPQNSQR
jgi:hypothetical protein